MLYLKVPRKDAEKTRRKLMQEGALSREFGIINRGEFILLPLSAPPSGLGEIVELDAEKREARARTLKDELSGALSGPELDFLTTSFDIVGDIAIVEVPPELSGKEREIGEALLRVHKNIRTVLKKLGGMEGEFRVRRFALIAGEDRTETIYRESGLRMKLDLAKVYFSVRLAHERTRIAGLAGNGESVLVLFAGVGPFALVIAKRKPKTRVVAVEMNPDAARYLRENIALNRIRNVEAIEGDAKKVRLPESGFDRVVMPLPKSAHEFLDVAFRAVKDGGTVHLYSISEGKDPFADPLRKAREEAEKAGVGIEPRSMRIARPYSPSKVQVAIDLKVKK